MKLWDSLRLNGELFRLCETLLEDALKGEDMPSRSKAQQALMGADLARKRAGKPTKTGLNEAQLTDFAETPTKSLPKRIKKGK